MLRVIADELRDVDGDDWIAAFAAEGIRAIELRLEAEAVMDELDERAGRSE